VTLAGVDPKTVHEAIIYRICKDYVLPKPRTYRKVARKNYLALAKTKKRS
jgi:hypothetical protein